MHFIRSSLIVLSLAIGLATGAQAQTTGHEWLDEAAARNAAGDTAGLAEALGHAIAAFEISAPNDTFLLSDLFYYKAAAEQRIHRTADALATLDRAAGYQPPLTRRLPDMLQLRAGVLVDFNLYSQAAGAYEQAATFMAMAPWDARFGPVDVAGAKLMAAHARARSSLSPDAERHLPAFDAALRDFEAALGQPFPRGALMGLGVAELTGRVLEAREGYRNLAATSAPDVAVWALKDAALLDWRLGRREEARIAASDALAMDGHLGPAHKAVLETLVALAGNRLPQLDAILKQMETEPKLAVRLRASVEVMMLVAAWAAGQEAPLDPSFMDIADSYVGKFGEDTLMRRLAYETRLSLAESAEAQAPARAQATYQEVWLSPSSSNAHKGRAAAGLARTGVRVEGTLKADQRLNAAMAETAARYAEAALSALPARQGPALRGQIARHAQVLVQAVEREFAALKADPPFWHCPDGPCADALFFPWTAEPGDGFLGLDQAGARQAQLARVFRQIQIARHSEAGQAIAAMTARLATGDTELAEALRARDTAIAARALAAAGGQGARAEVSRLDARITALEAQIAQAAPDYPRSALLDPMTLTEARDLLAEDEALILQLAGDDALHGFAVTNAGVVWHRARLGRSALRSGVQQLRLSLDPTAPTRAAAALDAEPGDDAPAFDPALAHQLYQAALGPVLRHVPRETTLLIVPDDALQTLPFGVLIAQPPEAGAALEDLHWAIRDHAFATLPVAGSLRALRRDARASAATLPFVGIGDPLFDPVRQGVPLAPLPETAGELRILRERLGGGALHLRADAALSALDPAQLGAARVLAFATHGLLGGEVPGLAEPALALTPGLAGDRGLLTASAIAELRLDADWVILSACNTGAGPDAASTEGLSGLARAFFYAGARRVLVSHWPVQSDATVALTTGLVAELERASGPQSLRRAMLAMLDGPDAPASWRHPAVWGPFVVAGG